MSDSLIIRSNIRQNFTVIPNEMANDDRLGADALGLLVYLLTKPNDWVVRVNELRNRFDIGKDKTYRILATLEQYGYVTRESVREEGKFAQTLYTVRDAPCPDFSDAVLPDAENPPLTKNRPNKELKNTKSNKKYTIDDLTLTDEMRAYAEERGLDADEILTDIQLWNESLSKKKQYASLNAFWQGWCRREAKRAPRASNRQQSASKVVTKRELSEKQKEYAKMVADKLYAKHAHEFYKWSELHDAAVAYLSVPNADDAVWQAQGTGLANPFN